MGVKLYSMRDSETSYLLDFQIVKETETLHSMVLYVASSYSDAWRILHMDDFYNSIKISHDIYKLKIHNNGTLRSSRDVPHEPMQILSAKHDTIEKKLDNIVNFFIFHDSKIIKFINTALSNEYIINKKCNS